MLGCWNAGYSKWVLVIGSLLDVINFGHFIRYSKL